MRKILAVLGIIVIILIVIVFIILIFLILNSPKQKDFAYLQQPRIIEKKDVKAMVVHFHGDPEVVIKEAYSKLFKIYYRTRDVPRGFKQKPPLARYQDFDRILERVAVKDLKSVPWKGFVAVPVPDDLQTLPEDAAADAVLLMDLKYGMVAEIVHFGTYESEESTINQLKQFILDQNYEISGLHEEEYIKGPGLPFVQPEDYITIIRYQVKKK